MPLGISLTRSALPDVCFTFGKGYVPHCKTVPMGTMTQLLPSKPVRLLLAMNTSQQSTETWCDHDYHHNQRQILQAGRFTASCLAWLQYAALCRSLGTEATCCCGALLLRCGALWTTVAYSWFCVVLLPANFGDSAMMLPIKPRWYDWAFASIMALVLLKIWLGH